jgi:hypothetical protein
MLTMTFFCFLVTHYKKKLKTSLASSDTSPATARTIDISTPTTRTNDISTTPNHQHTDGAPRRGDSYPNFAIQCR